MLLLLDFYCNKAYLNSNKLPYIMRLTLLLRHFKIEIQEVESGSFLPYFLTFKMIGYTIADIGFFPSLESCHPTCDSLP